MALRRGLTGLFQDLLKKRPVLTNMIVYGTFYTAAEMSQQTFNKYLTADRPDYDFKAAARIVGVGSCVYAPILTIWYRYLDNKYIGKTVRIVITKVCLEQFCMTPVLISIFFPLLSILEGKEDIFAEFRQKFVKTFIANQSFWIPAQTVNFAMVSPQFRVVYVACASLLWINVVCFIKRQKLQEVEELKQDLVILKAGEELDLDLRDEEENIEVKDGKVDMLVKDVIVKDVIVKVDVPNVPNEPNEIDS